MPSELETLAPNKIPLALACERKISSESWTASSGEKGTFSTVNLRSSILVKSNTLLSKDSNNLDELSSVLSKSR